MKSAVLTAAVEHDEGFLSLDRATLAEGKAPLQELTALRRWMALAHTGIFWVAPTFGKSAADIPPETQLLLWQNADGRYGLLLPLVDGDLRATAVGNPGGVSLRWSGSDDLPEHATLAYMTEGGNPFVMITAAMAAVSARLGSFRLRLEKAVPAFAGMLGWCTWDAFYQGVDEEKVIAGLTSFKKAKFPLRYMILDDGWLDTSDDFYLNSFRADKVKFPAGLARVSARAKQEFGLDYFGIWHAFMGYWRGPHPKGELAGEYRTVGNMARRSILCPWMDDDATVALHMVDPRDMARFYQNFYRYLSDEGGDMVKVDGQAALALFSKGKCGEVSTMQKAQKAMQDAVVTHFGGQSIHCMCHSNGVAYNLKNGQVWRNSEDYQPRADVAGQQQHVHHNALNSFWSSQFALPDWDGFQSHGPCAEFHAAARAISGGPVYVTDEPGKQDFDLLRRLCDSRGRLLQCDRPALPAHDCLLVDCGCEEQLLKVTNVCGKTGVLGLFHVRQQEARITSAFQASDVPELKDDQYLVWFTRQEKAALVTREERLTQELDRADYEIVTLTPFVNGMAAIGLIDRFVPAAGIDEVILFDEGIRVRLQDGGTLGLYVRQVPSAITMAGEALPFTATDGLIQVQVPDGTDVEVEVRL